MEEQERGPSEAAEVKLNSVIIEVQNGVEPDIELEISEEV